MRAWALCWFHSLISTQTFQRALTASVDSCAEIKKCPFSGVTNSVRVWRKVPESDARSEVGDMLSVSSGHGAQLEARAKKQKIKVKKHAIY